MVIGFFTAFCFGPRPKTVFLKKKQHDKIIGDLDEYLNIQENKVDGVLPWAQKKIVWNDEGKKNQSDWAIIYIHGFSASLGEISPVPERVAEKLGANIFFTRLAGHGLKNAREMEGIDINDWYADVQEALEIGKRIGKKLILISTSTGGTLVTQALADFPASYNIVGSIFISPNFKLKYKSAMIFKLPWYNFFIPFLLGSVRKWQPASSEQKKFWTTTYPTVALTQVVASVTAVQKLNFGKITTPGLFMFSDRDTVVDPLMTARVASEWGGPSKIIKIEIGPDQDDKGTHVVLGDILSPSRTKFGVRTIYDWISSLEVLREK